MQSSTEYLNSRIPRHDVGKDGVDVQVYSLGKKVFDDLDAETIKNRNISFENNSKQQNQERRLSNIADKSHKDDGMPVTIKKSMLSTTRIMVLKSKHEHTIAATYFRGQHNTFIFVPLELLALVLSTLGFLVSTQNNKKDPTRKKSKKFGIVIGVLGSLTVFIQAIGKQLNWDGRASMHEFCAFSMRRILQDIHNADCADPDSPSLFEKSSSDTILHITGREVKMLEKAETDYNTTLESCRSLIPSVISNAFSKMEVEFVLMVSPAGSRGSLLDDVTSYMLLEYCFAELAIVLGECIQAPAFVLPSPEWAVRKAMNSVKDRLRSDAEQDLTDYFPYSRQVKQFRKINRDTIISPVRESNWITRMSTAFRSSTKQKGNLKRMNLRLSNIIKEEEPV